MNSEKSIGIAFSGGGVRAIAFHAGAMRWLAEINLLENISHVSSVSGGSLFMGLLLKAMDYSWPTSRQYTKNVFPWIEGVLTKRSLQRNMLIRLINPLNWKYALTKADLLSNCIQSVFNIEVEMQDLPKYPIWSINGVVSETGHRFRFKSLSAGSYSVGYMQSKNFPLSKALAMSAAFPGLIGPLTLHSDKYQWKNWDRIGAFKTSIDSNIHQRLHLYDGGVYDNLGLESLFDSGKQCIRDQNPTVNYIIVSDASEPLASQRYRVSFRLKRLMRIINMMHNQNRSLRVRAYVNHIIETGRGLYFQSGRIPVDAIRQYRLQNPPVFDELLCEDWQCKESILAASHFETSLKSMSLSNFKLISQHGYETAKWNTRMFMK